MGQFFAHDPYLGLKSYPEELNSKPALKMSTFKTFPQIKVNHYQIAYATEDDRTIQCIYRFQNNRYVPVKLTKKKSSYADELDGHLLGSGDHVYGYKIKYRPKQPDRIKYLLYKKRVYGDVQAIFDVLAELKFMSILQIGPYVGTMIDGSDGFIINNYAEYYSQNVTSFRPPDKEELKRRIQMNFQAVNLSKITNFGFSICFHQFVLRPEIKSQFQQGGSSQSPNKPLSSIFKQKPSQTLRPSVMQDKNLKQIKMIDEKTGMLSAIENCLIHKNIEKAVAIFEQSLEKQPDNKRKVKFIHNYVQLLSDCPYFKDYQQQVIQQFLQNSQLTRQSVMGQKDYGRQLQQRVNTLKLSSKQFSSENELQQFSQTFSINESSLQKQKLKLNIQDSNNQRVRQIIKQINLSLKGNENCFNQQITFQYGVMLMNTGKSNLALNLFHLLYRSEEVSLYTKYKISNFMGLIYYHRNYFREARQQFQKSLTKIIKMKYYSKVYALAYNNIGCTFYKQKSYKRSLQMFNHALLLQCGNNDYQVLVRNNRAVCYIRLDMIKQARQQLDNMLNKGEPVNNAIILCKLFTNIGYLYMKNKQFSKAKQEFKYAIQLQQKCLLPLGHRPSVFLHNNMAMTRFKLRQVRQALDHFSKYEAYFQNLQSVQGVMVNYNIALVHKQCYKLQSAVQYMNRCRRLICTLPAKHKAQFEKKIQIQLDNINHHNIDQQSDQSSHAVSDNRLSNLSKKMQQFISFKSGD